MATRIILTSRYISLKTISCIHVELNFMVSITNQELRTINYRTKIDAINQFNEICRNDLNKIQYFDT